MGFHFWQPQDLVIPSSNLWMHAMPYLHDIVAITSMGFCANVAMLEFA